jgi:alkylation response protein AidB-like acyl-CoA dehydrogenase
MNFELNEEQKMIQQMARGFAEKELKPRAAEVDATRRLSLPLLKAMATWGWLWLIPFPEPKEL